MDQLTSLRGWRQGSWTGFLADSSTLVVKLSMPSLSHGHGMFPPPYLVPCVFHHVDLLLVMLCVLTRFFPVLWRLSLCCSCTTPSGHLSSWISCRSFGPSWIATASKHLAAVLVRDQAATVASYLRAYKSWRSWASHHNAAFLLADSVVFTLYILFNSNLLHE